MLCVCVCERETDLIQSCRNLLVYRGMHLGHSSKLTPEPQHPASLASLHLSTLRSVCASFSADRRGFTGRAKRMRATRSSLGLGET